MGITISDIKLLEKAILLNPIKDVCELGSQNLYLNNEDKPPFASDWYLSRGINYTCIDLAGDNEALRLDLSSPIPTDDKFDLVTDFGTSEHIVKMKSIVNVAFHEGHINSIYPETKPTEEEILKGYYNGWKNKHDLLNVGGLMVCVNPKTGNWPDHGYTYLTLNFYNQLAYLMGYDILHLKENTAMGNTISGWNIECILKKIGNRNFISFEEFQTCEQFRS